MEREDVANVSRDAVESFVGDPPKDAHRFSVRATGGTSSSGPILAVTSHERYEHIYAKAWFTNAERILTCHGLVSIRFFYCAIASDVNPSGRILALDGTDLEESRASFVRDFAPDRIVGVPSFVARVAALFDRKTAEGVRSIKCASELLSRQYHDLFTSTFPNAVIASIYVSTEIGPISKESCGFRPPNFYHPSSEYHVEIDSPDADGFGDIVVSTYVYGNRSIDKYRIGDVGRMHSGTCACGEDVTFEILGRRGSDYVRFGGMLLLREEFDRVARLFPEIADYQVEATMLQEGTSLRGKIVVHAYARLVPTDARQKEIARMFASELFLTQDKTAADLADRGILLPLVFEWTNTPFPESLKTIRIRTV